MKNFFIATTILAIILGSIGSSYAATRLNNLKEFAILECRSVMPIGGAQQPSIKVVNISLTPGIEDDDLAFDEGEINCSDAVITITNQGFPILDTTIFDSEGTIIVMTFGR